jgi:hypothetical protein
LSGWTRRVYSAHAITSVRKAIETIEALPDDVPFDEIVYRLFVRSKAQEGVADIDNGRLISSEQLAQQIEKW